MQQIPPVYSVLESHPDYVAKIGMVSIENGNLELLLSDLLSAILDIPQFMGRAIYLTPKSAFARLDILQNVCVCSQTNDVTAEEFYQKSLASIITKAKSVIGRRHEIMHNAWGTDIQTGSITKMNFQDYKIEQYPLDRLAGLISDFRNLMSDIRIITESIQYLWKQHVERGNIPE